MPLIVTETLFWCDGRTFSLHQVRKSIKEEIDMTANAVTHQSLVCVCGYVRVMWGADRVEDGDLINKQDL